MSILKNAIDSIAIGLEDYQSPDERRVASCTRNIFAGILLLFKYKLQWLSPLDSDEILIKQQVIPAYNKDGSVIWVGKGKKTVDVQNIKERFLSLNISVDWSRIDRINQYRNEIEHYYSSLNSNSVQKLISDSFIIIRDFIVEHLQQDPIELLGANAWNVLLEVNEVYERERLACIDAIDSLDYFSEVIKDALKDYSCEDCGSDLNVPSESHTHSTEVDFSCKSCGSILAYEEIVKRALPMHYSFHIYNSHKDGEDSPLTHCSECGGPYLYCEKICASCGHTASHKCERCGSKIYPEEIPHEPLCGYCSHIMEKND